MQLTGSWDTLQECHHASEVCQEVLDYVGEDLHPLVGLALQHQDVQAEPSGAFDRLACCLHVEAYHNSLQMGNEAVGPLASSDTQIASIGEATASIGEEGTSIGERVSAAGATCGGSCRVTDPSIESRDGPWSTIRPHEPLQLVQS